MAISGIRNVILIGAGRLAVNFALSLRKKGIPVLQVYNRSQRDGQHLARQISAEYINDISSITGTADLYALAVSDQALPEIAGKIKLNDQPVIHFSGTADLQLLGGISTNTGVFYAPQSFTFGRKPGFLGIPICIEASNEYTGERLAEFARIFTNEVYRITAVQRRTLHISAIFAGNFTNYMVAIAEDLLKKEGLSTALIRPVIEKTRHNAMKGNVFSLQTGPAIREDLLTIFEHLESLSGIPEYREIYRLISESIIQRKKHDQDDKL